MAQNSDSANVDRDSASAESDTVWDTVKLVLGLLLPLGIAIASLAVTVRALLELRPLSWWLRTDACPDPAVTCGQPPWAAIAVVQVIMFVAFAKWLFDTFSGDTLPRGGW